ncbi:MAG: hypothetical protein JWP65_2883 [Ramlibacter sp.]|jgi:hypothetical protein|uniref:hypothetical protein n=1 Tax=Ramlibacter sp. TaxID=1917967 RepID=UPI002633E7FF|nr:hypothetical protein [Ramlibacter sp.]MDB5752462.1 hypothetical protein [Ramlibacter sp.]
MKLTLSRTLILAAAVSAGGIAQAQTRAAETTNLPQRAGEASTMTGGAPNAKTTNTTTTDKKTSKADRKAATKAGNAGRAKANETSNIPQRAGEASTMTGGAPNAKTTN